jgi:hypothetical protein
MSPRALRVLPLALLCACDVWKPYLDGGTSEDCTSPADDDADGLINGDDPDCWPGAPEPAAAPEGQPTAPPEPPPAAAPTEICAGADDEDGDGLVGCADPDCAADAACAPPAAPPSQP